MKKIGVFIIAVFTLIFIDCNRASAAQTVSSSNEVKILIGIAVLCVVTFLVILKRIMYAKKNN